MITYLKKFIGFTILGLGIFYLSSEGYRDYLKDKCEQSKEEISEPSKYNCLFVWDYNKEYKGLVCKYTKEKSFHWGKN